MGGCASITGVKTPDVDVQKIAEFAKEYCYELPKQVKEKYEQYKEQMKNHHPEKWQVPDDCGAGEKVFLQHEVDDDKKVKTTAIIVVAGKKFKTELGVQVWKLIEPKVSEQLDGKHEMIKTAGLKAARAISDKAAEKAADEIIKKFTETYVEGKSGDGAADGEVKVGDKTSLPVSQEKSERPESETKAHEKQAALAV